VVVLEVNLLAARAKIEEEDLSKEGRT